MAVSVERITSSSGELVRAPVADTQPSEMDRWGGPEIDLARVFTTDVRARAATAEFLLQCQVTCGRWRPSDQAKCYVLQSPQCWCSLNDCTEGALADCYTTVQKKAPDFQLVGAGLSAHRRFAAFLERLVAAT